jgi:hypothetical protein
MFAMESIGAEQIQRVIMVPKGNNWLHLQHCGVRFLRANSLILACGARNNAGFAISHIPNIPLP